MPDLRKAFFKKMCELAEKDKDVVLITGDLGYSFMEEYAQKYPDQFINFGIAEQAMIGVAAGMALGGKKPYVYSGAIFLLMRPYEQVRDDVCYNNLNVKLVGTGASGFLGFTHNLMGTENEEDLLKNLPNLTRHYPKTDEELHAALLVEGPAYVRL
jgi:transketolase